MTSIVAREAGRPEIKLKFAAALPSLGYTGPTSIGDEGMAFTSRAAIATATVEAVRKYAHTAGYAAAGDGGHALYKRMATAPTDPTNRAYVRSVDRFTSAGATDATNGGYWQIVPTSGEVTIEQFGGFGDTVWNGALGTDCYPALANALAYRASIIEAAVPDLIYVHTIRYGVGRYYHNATHINVNVVVRILGQGGFIENQGTCTGTVWVLPGTSHGIIFHNSNTSDVTGATQVGSASGSVFEGISLDFANSATPTTQDTTKVAVHIRTQMLCQRVAVLRAPGKGFYIHATAGAGGAQEGNANNWALRDCSVYSAGYHALHIEGSDANGGSCIGFVTGPGEVAGCGILENSGLGSNFYAGLQISGCGAGTFTGARGVHRDGRRYFYIWPDSSQGTVTPGTNSAVWLDIGAGAVDATYFPEWVSSGTAHFPRLPVLAAGTPSGQGSQRSVFMAPYVEGSAPCHIAKPNLTFGGQTTYTQSELASSNLFTNPGLNGIVSNVGFVSYQNWPTISTSYEYAGDSVTCSYGTQSVDEPSRGRVVWGHQRGIESGPFEFRYEWQDMRYGQAGYHAVLRVTTEETVRTFGRTSTVPHHLVVEDMVLGDPNSTNNGRVIGFRDAQPLSGEHAQGEIYFNCNASAGGTFAWVCVTSGTPGTWKAIPVPA